MKRVLTFLAIMLLPLSVMAMTPVTDSDLADVTGQAGVNINADLTMNIGIGTMAWGDNDGITGQANPWTTTAAGGYVGVTGFNITNLVIKARETDTYGAGYPTPDGHYHAVAHILKPITIDVATDPGMYGGNTFVRFGLGSLQITMGALDFGVELGPDTGLGQVMGVVSVGAMGVYFNPLSYVDIYAQTDCGVGITMHVIVDQFNMSYISWGDTDGQALVGSGGIPWMSEAGAGYVGLANLSVGGPIVVAGTVFIDVNTTTLVTDAYTNGGGYSSVSVVHISFPDLFTIRVAGPITASVMIDNVKTLNSGVEGSQLGDIYISGLNVQIAAGSWVDIWAH